MTEQNIIRKIPRFHKSVAIPVVPEGYELHKFHKEFPVLLSAKQNGEPMFANSNFTERQVMELQAYESARLRAIEEGINPRHAISEMQKMTVGLNSIDSNTQALRDALLERPCSAPNKVAKDGILLIPNTEVNISSAAEV